MIKMPNYSASLSVNTPKYVKIQEFWDKILSLCAKHITITF